LNLLHLRRNPGLISALEYHLIYIEEPNLLIG